MRIINYILIFCTNYVCLSEPARILAHLMVPSVSHANFFQPIWRELSLRGHEVTVVTANPIKDPSLTNLTEIIVDFTYNRNLRNCETGASIVKNMYGIMERFYLIPLEYQLNHTDVKEKIMKLDENHFDLVIVEGLHPLIFGYGGKFKAPIVAISSGEIFPFTYDVIGNPIHPLIGAYYENHSSLYQTFYRVFFHIWSMTLYYWYIIPNADALAKKYFGNDIPPILDLVRNTSLVLVNRNPILNIPRANIPSIIEIGQLHLKDPKPLPKDLQQYLDNSTRGVVYFSLGTNVFSSILNPTLTENIKMALGEIPYDVIWKFEGGDLPGKPPNVLLRKWLPQQDLLRHPNVKVFVTQGGVQSMDESIFGEVPMVGIPFHGDQPMNVKVINDKIMGIGLDCNKFSRDSLRNAILEVAGNKTYKQQVIKYKRLLEDQPIRGLEKAIWWIEYAVRNKGAQHLKNPAPTMSYYQYFLIEIFGCILFIIFSFVYVILAIKKLYARFNVRNKAKVE